MGECVDTRYRVKVLVWTRTGKSRAGKTINTEGVWVDDVVLLPPAVPAKGKKKRDLCDAKNLLYAIESGKLAVFIAPDSGNTDALIRLQTADTNDENLPGARICLIRRDSTFDDSDECEMGVDLKDVEAVVTGTGSQAKVELKAQSAKRHNF